MPITSAPSAACTRTGLRNVERHQRGRANLRERALCGVQVVQLERLPRIERDRRHLVQRREIRVAAVGADERACAAITALCTARLRSGVSPSPIEMIRSQASGIQSACSSTAKPGLSSTTVVRSASDDTTLRANSRFSGVAGKHSLK